MQIRAYSTLELKDVSSSASGKRVFSGIASTPSLDWDGDIVEPKGASFRLPIPFLWQHDAKDPIGWINEATVQDKGILIKGEVAMVDGDSPLAARLSNAWDYISAGLVKGLSVGFKAMERERIANSTGFRILKWGWFELSAVTMPANADCSIMALKSADESMRRASLGAEVHQIVRLGSGDFPAVAGPRRLPGVTYLDI
jgi:HK97 family phage prohead protease